MNSLVHSPNCLPNDLHLMDCLWECSFSWEKDDTDNHFQSLIRFPKLFFNINLFQVELIWQHSNIISLLFQLLNFIFNLSFGYLFFPLPSLCSYLQSFLSLTGFAFLLSFHFFLKHNSALLAVLCWSAFWNCVHPWDKQLKKIKGLLECTASESYIHGLLDLTYWVASEYRGGRSLEEHNCFLYDSQKQKDRNWGRGISIAFQGHTTEDPTSSRMP